jgi:predicted nucleotidyltransferase
MSDVRLSAIPDHESIDDNLEQRFIEAWHVAFEVASILKRECHAEEVRITGSLLNRARFHEESDIDLVVTNFSMADIFECLRYLDAFSEWSIDIIPIQSLLPSKQAFLLERSVPLET